MQVLYAVFLELLNCTLIFNLLSIKTFISFFIFISTTNSTFLNILLGLFLQIFSFSIQCSVNVFFSSFAITGHVFITLNTVFVRII
jgi:hypothetical protein